MQKIAIVTANIGGIDNPMTSIPNQVGDGFIFTFFNLACPTPMPNLSNRMKARYIKTQLHHILPAFDIFIWIDGRVEITSKYFVSEMLKQLKEFDIVVTQHPDRDNVYEEIKFIQHELERGEPYLTARYKGEPFNEELLFMMRNNLPYDFPLFASGIYARRNSNRLNTWSDQWWKNILEYTSLDQTMFCYNIWKYKLRYYAIPYDNKYYKVGQHKK